MGMSPSFAHADVFDVIIQSKGLLQDLNSTCSEIASLKIEGEQTIDFFKNLFKKKTEERKSRQKSALPAGWDDPYFDIAELNLGICDTLANWNKKTKGMGTTSGELLFLKDFQQSSAVSGLGRFQDLLFGFARIIAYLLIPLSLAYAFLNVTRIVFDPEGASDNASKAKNNLINMGVGLILFSAAPEFTKIFDIAVSGGNIGNIEQGEKAFGLIIHYLALLSGGVAVFFIFSTAARILVSGGDDGNKDLLKKRLLFSSLGLVLIIMANTIVNRIVYPSAVQPAGEGQVRLLFGEIMGILQYVFGYGAMIVMGMIIFTGVSIMMSQDDTASDRAKTLLKNLAIGFVSLYLAYTAVSFIVPKEDASEVYIGAVRSVHG